MSGHQSYPSCSIEVIEFNGDLGAFFPCPPGIYDWPPVQISYLTLYLANLGCRTVVRETHYVDRDFIDDVARFYSRNLRSYPNYCERLHFFGAQFDATAWENLLHGAAADAGANAQQWLQSSYLGFAVRRPLPGAPLGRAVFRVVGPTSEAGLRRSFEVTREYQVHLAGLDLTIDGLAFQQQDQGVSACATTALWSALHAAAHRERLHIPTPSEITESASRYLLTDGRAMPSEGLRVEQICEATRATGLAPLLIRSLKPDEDRAQLSTFIRSGFPLVLALSIRGAGHAVCCVGLKEGDVKPQTDPQLHFRDGASRVRAVYIHDDRLGPYADAELRSRTIQSQVRTSLLIRWPDGTEDGDPVLHAMLAPVPPKLRLGVVRLRALGFEVAEFIATAFPRLVGSPILDTRYELATSYKKRALGFGLSTSGLFDLQCRTVLSRYVGLIEITNESGPLLDVLLDTTETGAGPCVLACVKRGAFPQNGQNVLTALSRFLNANVLS